MSDEQLTWAGDHFTTAVLAQLREDREQKAVAWLDQELKGLSGETKAGIVVLVVPEQALRPGALLNLRTVSRLDPPLGYSDGPDGWSAEGRYFTSDTRPGRVLVLRNGVIEGVAWLGPHAQPTNKVNLDPIHSNIEDNLGMYLRTQRNVLELAGPTWVMLTLAHTDGLRAYNGTSRRSDTSQAATQSRIAVPPLLMEPFESNGPDTKVVAEAVRKVFDAIAGAFDL